LINSSLNFENLSFLVHNLSSLVSEELPPSWGGSGTSHISWSTVWLDIKWVALPVVALNGLGYLIEEPLLLSGTRSPSLEPDIVGTVAFSNSLEWQSWSHIEWSVDMEAELIVHSLGSILIRLINIDDLPLLVLEVTCLSRGINTNTWGFFILGSFNLKDLAGLPVHEIVVLILENLPPIWVGTPDLHVIWFTRALDVEWFTSPFGFDC
jgi:hypothetical protein